MLKNFKSSSTKKELLEENAMLATKVIQLKGVVADLKRKLDRSRRSEEKLDRAKWALEMEHLRKINYWERTYQDLEDRYKELEYGYQSLEKKCEFLHILNTNIKQETDARIKKNEDGRLFEISKLKAQLTNETNKKISILEKSYTKSIEKLNKQNRILQQEYETLKKLLCEMEQEQVDSKPLLDETSIEMLKTQNIKLVYENRDLKTKLNNLNTKEKNNRSRADKQATLLKKQEIQIEQLNSELELKKIEIQKTKENFINTRVEYDLLVSKLKTDHSTNETDVEKAQEPKENENETKKTIEKDTGLFKIKRKESFVVVGKIDLSTIDYKTRPKKKTEVDLLRAIFEYEQKNQIYRQNSSNRLNNYQIRKKYGKNELWRNNRKRCYPRRISTIKSTRSAKKRNHRHYRLRRTRTRTIPKPARQRLQCHCRSAKRQQIVGQSRYRRLDSGRNTVRNRRSVRAWHHYSISIVRCGTNRTLGYGKKTPNAGQSVVFFARFWRHIQRAYRYRSAYRC